MTTRHGLTRKNGYWACIHPDYPYGEAIKVGAEWEAHSNRDHSITAYCKTLLEAAQFLYHG
jgi:hypothetical protein